MNLLPALPAMVQLSLLDQYISEAPYTYGNAMVVGSSTPTRSVAFPTDITNIKSSPSLWSLQGITENNFVIITENLLNS